MLVKVQSAISLLTCGCLVCVAASPSSIGFVVTTGQAQFDGMAVHGNSTLFAGNCGTGRKCDIRSHVSVSLQSTSPAGVNGHGVPRIWRLHKKSTLSRQSRAGSSLAGF